MVSTFDIANVLYCFLILLKAILTFVALILLSITMEVGILVEVSLLVRGLNLVNKLLHRSQLRNATLFLKLTIESYMLS